MVKVINTTGLGLRLADVVDELGDGVVYDDVPAKPITHNGKLKLQHIEPPQRQPVERMDFGYPLEEDNSAD